MLIKKNKDKYYTDRDQRGLIVFKRSAKEGFGEIYTGIREAELEAPINPETRFTLSEDSISQFLLINDARKTVKKFRKIDAGFILKSSKIEFKSLKLKVGDNAELELNKIFKSGPGFNWMTIIIVSVLVLILVVVILMLWKSKGKKDDGDTFSRVDDGVSFEGGSSMSTLQEGSQELDDEEGLVHKRKSD